MTPLPPIENKVFTLAQLVKRVESIRGNTPIFTTNGCFDILHYGHIHYLTQAKMDQGFLICLVNSDSSIKRLKGPNRPIFAADVRLRQVAALEAVDAVAMFEEDTPVQSLLLLKPDVHFKGADYANKKIPEQDALMQWGGKLKFLELVSGVSTTSISEKLMRLG